MPLYRLEGKDNILKIMARFDRWGLRPEGLAGKHENLLLPDLGSEL
jgi:hypothetical protein